MAGRKKSAKKKATKKAAKKTSAVAIREDMVPSNEADIAAMLDDYAQQGIAGEVVSGTGRIKIESGKFVYDGKEGKMILEEPLPVIILDDMHDFVLYDSAYDPENPAPPACFAIGKKSDEMFPHESVPDPFSSSCEACENNQWGSAEVGKGKACGNRRRLAVIGYQGTIDMECEVVRLDLSPKSLSNYANFKTKLATGMKLPTFGGITHLTLEQMGSYSIVEFELADKIKNKQDLAVVMTLREQSSSMLEQPHLMEFEDSAPKKKKASKKKKGARKKKAAKKKGKKAKY